MKSPVTLKKKTSLPLKISIENVNDDILKEEAVVQRWPVKKVVLKISQNSQEKTCAIVYFLIKLQAWYLQLYQKDTLAQVFSCEFYKIFKNTFL